MNPQSLVINNKVIYGYVIPLGPVNLVFVKTEQGVIACGAIDVTALAKFGVPAAKVKSATGGPIATLDDLLNGSIREVNEVALQRGMKVGLPVKEALALI